MTPASEDARPITEVLHFGRDASQARALAKRLDAAAREIGAHAFPDGETRVTLPQPQGERVAVFATLDDPDRKLVALMLAARAARAQGARWLALVAPYLSYMRQDVAFAPGEAVSQRIVGEFLAGLFDEVITVDPHLHRVRELADAVPARRAVALSAAAPVGEFVRGRVPGAILVGPDAESRAWVSAAAAHAGLDYAVCVKRRSGDREVEVALPAVDFGGRAAVLVDDVASTGRTLESAARALLAAGAVSVDVVVTHALFVGDAIDAMRAAGVREIWSTDAIAHPTNTIELAPLLAEALR